MVQLVFVAVLATHVINDGIPSHDRVVNPSQVCHYLMPEFNQVKGTIIALLYICMYRATCLVSTWISINVCTYVHMYAFLVSEYTSLMQSLTHVHYSMSTSANLGWYIHTPR